MILSGKEIEREINNGNIVINHFHRLGLCIHITAGFGDIGFAGYWTLEIYCIHPLIIYPDIEVCQIYYHTIKGDYDLYNSGKYQNNTGIQSSMMYKDFMKEVCI